MNRREAGSQQKRVQGSTHLFGGLLAFFTGFRPPEGASPAPMLIPPPSTAPPNIEGVLTGGGTPLLNPPPPPNGFAAAAGAPNPPPPPNGFAEAAGALVDGGAPKFPFEPNAGDEAPNLPPPPKGPGAEADESTPPPKGLVAAAPKGAAPPKPPEDDPKSVELGASASVPAPVLAPKVKPPAEAAGCEAPNPNPPPPPKPPPVAAGAAAASAPNAGAEDAAPNAGAGTGAPNGVDDPAPNAGAEDAAPNAGAEDAAPNAGAEDAAPNAGVGAKEVTGAPNVNAPVEAAGADSDAAAADAPKPETGAPPKVNGGGAAAATGAFSVASESELAPPNMFPVDCAAGAVVLAGAPNVNAAATGFGALASFVSVAAALKPKDVAGPEATAPKLNAGAEALRGEFDAVTAGVEGGAPNANGLAEVSSFSAGFSGSLGFETGKPNVNGVAAGTAGVRDLSGTTGVSEGFSASGFPDPKMGAETPKEKAAVAAGAGGSTAAGFSGSFGFSAVGKPKENAGAGAGAASVFTGAPTPNVKAPGAAVVADGGAKGDCAAGAAARATPFLFSSSSIAAFTFFWCSAFFCNASALQRPPALEAAGAFGAAGAAMGALPLPSSSSIAAFTFAWCSAFSFMAISLHRPPLRFAGSGAAGFACAGAEAASPKENGFAHVAAAEGATVLSVKVYLMSMSGISGEPMPNSSNDLSSCELKVKIGSSSSSSLSSSKVNSRRSHSATGNSFVAKGKAVTGAASPKVNTRLDSVSLAPKLVDGGVAAKSGAGGAAAFAAAADAAFPNPIAGDGAAGVFVSLNASGSNCNAEGMAPRVTGTCVGLECDAMGAEVYFSADASAFAGVAL